MHRSAWPVADELPAGGDPEVVTAAAEALAAVRKAKSEAKQSMRADVASAVVTAPDAHVALVEAARVDLTHAGRIAELSVVAGEGPLRVDVVLAEPTD